MSASLWPLQQAIYATLTAGSPAPVSAPVYDAVPQDTAYPYVQIGDDLTVADFSAVSREGDDVDFHIHTWSRYAGKKEAMQIMAEVKAALQDRKLSVPGWHIAGLREDFATIFTEPDGKTRHGVQRFRVRIRRTA